MHLKLYTYELAIKRHHKFLTEPPCGFAANFASLNHISADVRIMEYVSEINEDFQDKLLFPVI